MNAEQNLLWWLIPGRLGGMSMPYFHPERWANNGKTSLTAYQDDLPLLAELGIRAVVSFLNLPGAKAIYSAAGIDFLNLPIVDGAAPDSRQARQFIQFVEGHLARNEAVAAHCAAGLGRTGTMLAAYLIGKGHTAQDAIREVRRAQPAAIETRRQVDFLHGFAREESHSRRS